MTKLIPYVLVFALPACAAQGSMSRKTASAEVQCPAGMDLFKDCQGSGPFTNGKGKVIVHVAICTDGNKYAIGFEDSEMAKGELTFSKKVAVNGNTFNSFYNSRPTVVNGELIFTDELRDAATFTDGHYYEANYKASLKCD